MKLENLKFVTVLEESLGKNKFLEEKNPPAAKQSFMKLEVTYFCRAGEQPVENCIYFSPTPTGNCTFQNGEFCRQKERGKNI